MKLLIAVQLGEFFKNIVVKCQELLRSIYIIREETENNSRKKNAKIHLENHIVLLLCTILYVQPASNQYTSDIFEKEHSKIIAGGHLRANLKYSNILHIRNRNLRKSDLFF